MDEESNNCDNYTKEYNQKEVVVHTLAIKKLTKEQIDEIHSRGKITPEEMVKEWESLDLCAPGDGAWVVALQGVENLLIVIIA